MKHENHPIFELAEKPLAMEPGRFKALASQARAMLVLGGPERDERKPYRLVDGIAVFDIRGPLFNGEHRFMQNILYKNLQKNYRLSLDDPEVQGVLLNLDSPGGEAGGLFDLVDEIYNARGLKPTWAIANDEAFSAAYGIASATERVYVTRTGGVGSVGVFAAHLEFSRELEQMGWTFTLFRGGKYKAEQNPVEPLSDHARKSIQDEVDRLYNMFTETVARNRGMAPDTVRQTEAALYFGENALAAGLADRLGTMDEAIRDLRTHITEREGNRTMFSGLNPQAEIPQQQPAEPALQDQKNNEAEVDIDTISRESAARARDACLEIIEICRLANKPQWAAHFIAADVPPDQVREQLVTQRAEESDRLQLDNHLVPPTGEEKTRQGSRLSTAECYRKFNSHLR